MDDGNVRRPPGLQSPSRRRVLAGVTTVATLALTPRAVWAAVHAGAAAANGTAPYRELLDAVCDLVIPSTDTPGALQARVPEFVMLAVAHRLANAEPDALQRLAAELARRMSDPFLSLDAARRLEVLRELDAEAFSERGRALSNTAVATADMAAGLDLANWRALKTLIVVGYYTSEPGATQELRYEFVPGRYDADIPFRFGDRALMNDWWGNTF